nr:hypothetical protein [uncultured Rothia sp.]
MLTVGLTATISGQLADSFDIFRAKHLTISSTRTEPMSRAELLSLAASENYRRVSQLNGVTGTALVDQLDESADVQRGPDNFGERGANVTAAVLAATPSIFSVQVTSWCGVVPSMKGTWSGTIRLWCSAKA